MRSVTLIFFISTVDALNHGQFLAFLLFSLLLLNFYVLTSGIAFMAFCQSEVDQSDRTIAGNDVVITFVELVVHDADGVQFAAHAHDLMASEMVQIS